MGMEEHEEIDAIVPIEEEMGTAKEENTDVDMSAFEEAGEGEPTNTEIQDLTDAAIRTIQTVDEIHRDLVADVALDVVYDDIAPGVRKAIPTKWLQKKHTNACNWIEQNLRDARDVPARAVTEWLENFGDDPTLANLDPMAFGEEVLEEVFPKLEND